MTGIFKANNPSGNAILFLYAIVLKLPMFLHVRMPQLEPLDGIFYKNFLMLLEPLTKSFSGTYSVVTFLLLFVQAIGFNRIVNAQHLHKQSHYLTGMSYLLITSLFSEWFSLSAPLVVNTFLIWIWGKLCGLYNNSNPKATIFNIGLATGLSSFIYFPSITFVLLIMVGIAIARPFRLQEWLLGMLGIFTPVYFFAAYLFLTGNIKTFNFPGIHLSYPRFFGNIWAYIALVVLAMAIVIGLYFINVNMRRQLVQTRKSWQLLFLYLMVAGMVPFLNAGINFSYWILLALPVSSVIAATFYYPQKKLFPLVLHWAMFAIYIAVGFLHK